MTSAIKNVFWTDLGSESYTGVVAFVAEFSLKAAIELDEKVEHLLTRLSKHNFSCPPSSKIPRYRHCVVTKNVSVMYEIQEGDIFVVAVVDNRADHLYF